MGKNLLLGGSFQYFRVPRQHWRSCLENLSKILDFIDFYIPWNLHEYQDSKFDFTGEICNRADLMGLLELLEEYKLKALIRPGPVIYAEYPYFGIPAWLLKKHPEIRQLNQRGRWYDLPCYLHPIFLEYVKRWYRELFKLLEPRSHGILGIQLDNETGLILSESIISPTPCLRDLNPEMIFRFQRWLMLKQIPGFRPRIIKPWWRLRSKFENPDQILLWQEFLEDAICDYLEQLKSILLDLGIHSQWMLNEPAMITPPCNPHKKSKIGKIGYDVYPKVSDTQYCFDYPFLGCYASKLFENYSRYAAELGCGWFDPYSHVPLESTLQLLMMAIAHSTQMINLYLAHDGIELDGFPYRWNSCMDHAGNIQPRYEIVAKVHEFLDQYEDLILDSKEMLDPIAIAEYIPGNRIIHSDFIQNAAHLIAPQALMGLLHEVGANPRVIDLEQGIPQDVKLLMICSRGIMDAENFQKLQQFLDRGGFLVCLLNPITRDLQYQEIQEYTKMFPFELLKSKSYKLTRTMLHSTWILAKWRFKRAKIKSKWHLWTIDAIQQSLPSIRFMLDRELSLSYPDGKIKVFPHLNFYRSSAAQPIIFKGKSPLGYKLKLEHGNLIFIGALPGSGLAGPNYYWIPKFQYRDFANWMLNQAGITPWVRSQTEIVLRSRKDELLIFAFNRGFPKQMNAEFRLEFRNPERIFSHGDSEFDPQTSSLRLDRDDVLVMRAELD